LFHEPELVEGSLMVVILDIGIRMTRTDLGTKKKFELSSSVTITTGNLVNPGEHQ